MRPDSDLTAPATPRPWRIGFRHDLYDADGEAIPEAGFVSSIVGAGGEAICGTCDGCNYIKPADAELAVRAVNALEALVDALQHVQFCGPCSEAAWEKCEGGRAALAALELAKTVKP